MTYTYITDIKEGDLVYYLPTAGEDLKSRFAKIFDVQNNDGHIVARLDWEDAPYYWDPTHTNFGMFNETFIKVKNENHKLELILKYGS